MLYLPSEPVFLRLKIYKGDESYQIRVYIWNLTHGGGQFRPADEFRIQITGVERFENSSPEITLILGWWAEQNVFAAFDYFKHNQHLGRSPSMQVRRQALEEAHLHGFGIWKKETEIVVAVKPEYIIEYIRNYRDIHAFGEIPVAPTILEHALQAEGEGEAEIALVPADRQEVLVTLRKRSRDISFRLRILTAYGNTCAFCNIQLRLIDAAHILPVSVDSSSDETFNGIALCALHHRAYDRALVTFDESYRIRLNEEQLRTFELEREIGGIENFQNGLMPMINLPPAKRDRPHPEYVIQANLLRGWR